MKRPIAIVLSLLVLVALGVGAASAAEWSLVQVSGDVVIQVAGAQPVSLSRGAALPPGGVLRTGANSRAMLVRAEEQMIVGPNSVIALPAGAENRQFTNIVQGAGVVEFTVEKRNVQHFAVTTPQLAAVVKGTHFAVGVFQSGGVVKVERGRVEVTALESGQITDVLPGQEAVVRTGGALSLSGAGRLSPILLGPSPLSPDPSLGSGTTTASVGEGGTGLTIPGVASATVSDQGVSIELLGALGLDAGVDGVSADLLNVLGLEAGVDGVSANLNGAGVEVVAGHGGATVSVPGVVDVIAGSGGANVSVNGVVDVNAGNNGVNVDVGGLHIGLFGH